MSLSRLRSNRVLKDLAIQRALLLYKLAAQATKEGKYTLARRYIELGLKLIRKANAGKPVVYRRWVCKGCLIPLIPGLTATVRIRGNRKQVIIIKKCLLCGRVMRTPCTREEPRKKE